MYDCKVDVHDMLHVRTSILSVSGESTKNDFVICEAN